MYLTLVSKEKTGLKRREYQATRQGTPNYIIHTAVRVIREKKGHSHKNQFHENKMIFKVKAEEQAK